MQFTTPVPIQQSNNLIDYNSRIVSLGSCFAVNIGQKLDYFKFNNITNPFGILFHPAALEKFTGFAVNNHKFTEAGIFFTNDQWHCYDAHSDSSHPDKDVMLDNLNHITATANGQIKNATHIIITLGTAWVYRLKSTGSLVANCHKVPQKEFTKEILSADAVKRSLINILDMICKANPGVTVIFTISPVRHIKDGIVQNQRSKAHLITALQDILHDHTSETKTEYFPSYEIMMDELRDYRFYNQDMIHPSATAIDYIWERFTEAYIAPQAHAVMKEADSIQKGLQHRPFNPDTRQHNDFLAKLHQKTERLQQQYPHISF